MPGHLFLHLKLLYDGCKGVRDDQDHDPDAWDGYFDAEDEDADEDDDEDVVNDVDDEDADYQ